MKKIILLFIITIFPFSINAQHEFDDYIVIKNKDTIYGKISETLNYWHNNVYKLKDTNGKIYKVKRKEIIEFRFNDQLYKIDTLNVQSIFVKTKKTISVNSVIDEELISKGLLNRKEITYNNKKIRLGDFLILISGDTIYGDIKKNLNRKARLKTDLGEKYIISTKTVKQYRWNNDYYYYKKRKTAVRIGDNKNAFLKLLLNEKIKLYEYELKIGDSNHQNIGSEIYYFLEIKDKLKFVPKHRFLKTMVMLFKDDKDLVKRLKKREFAYSNMYLLVKEYNSRH